MDRWNKIMGRRQSARTEWHALIKTTAVPLRAKWLERARFLYWCTEAEFSSIAQT